MNYLMPGRLLAVVLGLAPANTSFFAATKEWAYGEFHAPQFSPESDISIVAWDTVIGRD